MTLWLNTLTVTPKNDFTKQDVYDAMTYFDDAYANYSIKAIEARTKIRIERNKRNGRKQAQHVRVMNAIREIEYPDGGWRNKDGRPKGSGTAEQKVAAYRAEHPEASVTEVARALEISRTTVYKWWGSQPAPTFYRYVPGGIEEVDPRELPGRPLTSQEEAAIQKHMKFLKR